MFNRPYSVPPYVSVGDVMEAPLTPCDHAARTVPPRQRSARVVPPSAGVLPWKGERRPYNNPTHMKPARLRQSLCFLVEQHMLSVRLCLLVAVVAFAVWMSLAGAAPEATERARKF